MSASPLRGNCGFLSILALAMLGACTTYPTPGSSNIFPQGAYAVSVETAILSDPSRSWSDGRTRVSTRGIPIKVYSPVQANLGPFPLLMLSHGLGGNLNAQSYLAEYLASSGYVVVSVQHHRSDSDYLKAHGPLAFTFAANESETRLQRPKDMSFVLDLICSGITGVALLAPSRIDLSKVGILGHSFGAFTTLACLGATFDDGVDASDPRILCGVAYSPQGPGTLGYDYHSWDTSLKPTMTLAGTADTSIGTLFASERRIPYDRMPATGAKYHETLVNAMHESFGDHPLDDGFYHEWIERVTLAFFEAYLRGDQGAKAYLDSKSIEAETSYVTQENK
jgi:predicted dienelactone hydrolase